ncbi:hypothetical protein SLEP1_g20219 [Rubroshorea leprosula]|uniref:Seed maturation-like protein n=1 Tax=Rubroshorea leprosula TaxID=152421 RepID=A0AAV5J804_9ROSI|nr:hypothetical protein SLEP1_g20219 [Rubroshorea leprosula]
MAATARGLILSRVISLSSPEPLRPSLSRLVTATNLPNRATIPATSSTRPATVTVSCLSGGGVSDDFVSTQKSNLDRGFLVIANMLKHIEPLDTSVISKGVSDSAKDSMKQTISTMLGLLPSDHFAVSISLSKNPFRRLLFSSIITGYTLWNAEYRISLTRNWDIPVERGKGFSKQSEVLEEKSEGGELGVGSIDELEGVRPQIFGDLSPEALNYIQKLQSELSEAEEELNAKKKENMQIEYERGSRNDLLEYLRSLDADMVTELSQPSSLEVEEITHQLVQNIVHRFFKDEVTSNFRGETITENMENHQDADDENFGTIGTSRDYLAKLLFWCMLMGHHLRGLENRLHLSCAVGLL